MEHDDDDGESRGENHEVVYGVEGSVCVTTGHEGETAFLGEKNPDPPDVAAPASAHKLCDQNGAGTAASVFNGHAIRAHEQGGLHPRVAGLGRGGSIDVDHPRAEGEDPRDQGGTRHDPSELWKRNTPFRVLAIEMNKCSKKRPTYRSSPEPACRCM